MCVSGAFLQLHEEFEAQIHALDEASRRRRKVILGKMKVMVKLGKLKQITGAAKIQAKNSKLLSSWHVDDRLGSRRRNVWQVCLMRVS